MILNVDNVLNSLGSLTLVVLGLLLFSCGEEEKIGIPANVIPIAKFSDIMAEVTLIEAVKNLNVSKELKDSDSFSAYYDGIWKKYDVDEEAFRRSFDFYKGQPEMMSQVYKSAAATLKEYEQEVEEEKESKRRDREEKAFSPDSIDHRKGVNRPAIPPGE